MCTRSPETGVHVQFSRTTLDGAIILLGDRKVIIDVLLLVLQLNYNVIQCGSATWGV